MLPNPCHEMAIFRSFSHPPSYSIALFSGPMGRHPRCPAATPQSVTFRPDGEGPWPMTSRSPPASSGLETASELLPLSRAYR